MEQAPANLGRRPAKRITRACDRCSFSRTRCISDGERPCKHCVDYGFACEYKRPKKKPGRRRLSKTLAKSTVDAGTGRASDLSDEPSSYSAPDGAAAITVAAAENYAIEPASWNEAVPEMPQLPSTTAAHCSAISATSFHNTVAAAGELPSIPGFSALHNPLMDNRPPNGAGNRLCSNFPPLSQMPSVEPIQSDQTLPQFGTWAYDYSSASSRNSNLPLLMPNCHVPQQWRPALSRTRSLSSASPLPCISSVSPPFLEEQTRDSSSDEAPDTTRITDPRLPYERYLAGYGAWLDYRYPILRPLVPHLCRITSLNLACDLLDAYFTDPSCSLFESASPYIIAQVFRKKSFLCKNGYRPTSPGLLAAMLWVAAQTSESFESGQARSRICDGLYTLCESLLAAREREQCRRSSGRVRHYQTCPQASQSRR